MLKVLSLKFFTICLFSTVLVIILFQYLKFQFIFEAIAFAIVLSLINSYLAYYIYKYVSFKKKERIKQENRKEFEMQTSHLLTILDYLPIVSFVVDNKYNFLAGNIKALEFFEVKGNDVFRQLSLDVFEEDIMEQVKEECEFIVNSKKIFVTDRLVKLKSGKQNWFKLRKIPILSEDTNNVQGIVVFARNIENERSAQLQRESYISTLSHDLKIPTIAQIRALELLISEGMGTINAQQKEILNLTLDSCHCMYDMLSTLLTTYKYENNDVSLNFEKVYMLKLLDEVFAKSNKQLFQKNITINVVSKDKFASCYADKAQIIKAFEILVDFCVTQATKNSKITCKMKKLNDSNSIYITFGFDSPHVTPELVNNLLKQYSTSAEKFDKVGTGLNLYLAKQIIYAHNGSMASVSKEASYNTYSVTIPCIQNHHLSEKVSC